MGQVVVVIAAPQDGERAETFAERLRGEGLKAYAQELETAWSEDHLGAVTAGWPEQAFVLFCLTEAGAEDPLLRRLIALAIDRGGADRYIFVVFDEAAARREDLATLLENHPVAGAGDVAPIAEHIRQQSAPAQAMEAPQAAEAAEDDPFSAPIATEDAAAAGGGVASALERQLQKRAERRQAIETSSDEAPPQRFGARRATFPQETTPPVEEELAGAPVEAETVQDIETPVVLDETPPTQLTPVEEALEGAPIEAPVTLNATPLDEAAPETSEDAPVAAIESLVADSEIIEPAPEIIVEQNAEAETAETRASAEIEHDGAEASAAAPEDTVEIGSRSDGEFYRGYVEAPEITKEAREEIAFEASAPAASAPAETPPPEVIAPMPAPEPAPAPPHATGNPPLMSMDKPLAPMPAPAAARAPAVPGVGAAASGEETLYEKAMRNKASASGMFANRPRAPEAAPAPPQPLAAPPPPALDRVDGMAFAPKTLRRGTPELLRVCVFKPKERSKALRAAKRADPRTSAAGAVAQLGQVERGAILSAVIDARGAEADQERCDATWTGDALSFDFAVTADENSSVKQALITVRLLADDAQIGAITFVRPLSRAKNDKPTKFNSVEKLRKVDRVFLSYASFDRDQVSLIASAYDRAGIECFFDRVGLKSGEEWKPRLLKEINKSDLFHLCWSRAAAGSEWVEKETGHAMKRRRKAKRPEITIQMLDGPPWAPHPDSLDDLNFDDYARAAIVGYERGRR